MPWASAPSSGGETQLHRAAPSGVCAPRCSPPGCSPAPSFHLPSPPLLRPPDHTLLPCLDGGSRVPEGWWAHVDFWLDLGPRQVGSWMCSVSEAGKWYLSLPQGDDVTDIQGDDPMGPPPSLIQGLSIAGVTAATPRGPESALCWEYWPPTSGLGPTLSFCSWFCKMCCLLQPHVRIMCTMKYMCIKSNQHTWKHIMFSWWGGVSIFVQLTWSKIF